ncbi:MAG TPA: hypothetical protein VFH45_12275 [Acidimicrobiales bacterium]|nr:hypothetical protein [Acidimicrobiales bacterium]
MDEPGRFFRPGADREELLDALAAGHGYDKHVGRRGEFGGRDATSREGYRAIAERVLDGAERGLALEQEGSQALLVGSSAEGAVVYINLTKLNRSTMFQPRRGVGVYLDGRALNQQRGAVRELDVDHLPRQRRPFGVEAAAQLLSAGRSGGDPVAPPKGRFDGAAWRDAVRRLGPRTRTGPDLGLER